MTNGTKNESSPTHFIFSQHLYISSRFKWIENFAASQIEEFLHLCFSTYHRQTLILMAIERIIMELNPKNGNNLTPQTSLEYAGLVSPIITTGTFQYYKGGPTQKDVRLSFVKKEGAHPYVVEITGFKANDNLFWEYLAVVKDQLATGFYVAEDQQRQYKTRR